MNNKKILVVDDSAAVQEMCRQILADGGYDVAIAANGVAALTYPDLDNVDLLILDTGLRDVSGMDTTRLIKTDGELFSKPILLLIPEDKARENESVELMGANAWLVKPFDPTVLLNKVNTILEEQEVMRQAREHLKRAAERTITRLADEHIQKAVEERTQIMVERAVQMVVSQVDQKAKHEVDTKVTNLTTEKEQELVRVTVQEVARNTVSKLADKRVAEAMERILNTETEKTVRKAADEVFPTLIRERIHESIENLLPKEVTRRVQKEAEEIVPEISEKLVNIIGGAANKIVPKISRDIVKEQAEINVESEVANRLPNRVQSLVHQEIDVIVRQKMEPYLREHTRALQRRITLLMGLFVLVAGLFSAVLVLDYMFGPLIPRPNRAPVTNPTAVPGESDEAGTGASMWQSLKGKVGLE